MSIYIKPIVRFVSAECGRGKTYVTCQHIANHVLESNHLYVAPTINLVKQTAEELKRFGVVAEQIHSEVEEEPIKSIISFLKSATHQGNVLLITWKAYSALPYFHQRNNWKIYIDELPQVDVFYNPMVPINHQFITDHVELDKSIN